MARKRMSDESASELPVLNPSSDAGKKKAASRNRSSFNSEKLIHIIPLIALVCAFILFWLSFSFPVKVMIEDGKVVSVSPILPSMKNNYTQMNPLNLQAIYHDELLVRNIRLSNATAETLPPMTEAEQIVV